MKEEYQIPKLTVDNFSLERSLNTSGGDDGIIELPEEEI